MYAIANLAKKKPKIFHSSWSFLPVYRYCCKPMHNNSNMLQNPVLIYQMKILQQVKPELEQAK